MKIHLYFNSTIAGHVNLDALMPDLSKRFPNSKVSIDNPYFGLKEITIKDPAQNIKLVKLKKDVTCDIDLSLSLSVFETLGYSYLDISFDIDKDLFNQVLEYDEYFINTFVGEGQIEIDGENKNASSILLPIFTNLFGQDILSYHENLEDDIFEITSRITDYKNKTHINPLLAGLNLSFAMNLSPAYYTMVEDFDDELEVLPRWKNISRLENLIYEDKNLSLRICKDKKILKSFEAFNFRYHFNSAIMDKFLGGAKGWLNSLNKNVSNIRENVSKDNSNPYYWKELKKKIEVMDLNFLEFNTYVVENSDLEAGFRRTLHLKEEYKQKIITDNRNLKRNLFRYLNEVRTGINNLSTPGHTHDEMFLQEETEKVNERILMLSFIAMSVPAIGALLSPGIASIIKIAAAIGVLLLPTTYFLIRNIIKKVRVNKNKKLEFKRLLEGYETQLKKVDLHIKSIEESKDMPADFKQQLIDVSKELESDMKNKIKDLKVKL